MLPDDDLYHVNVDLHGLTAGGTYHYRLVTTSSSGTSYGKDETFAAPAIPKPQVQTGGVSRLTSSTARLEGRMNPMGFPSYYYFEYGTDSGYTGGRFSMQPQPL